MRNIKSCQQELIDSLIKQQNAGSKRLTGSKSSSKKQCLIMHTMQQKESIVKTDKSSPQIQPESSIKPKRKEYTRQEQYEHGPERKKSFNRRWSKTPKKERDALAAIYPGRNTISFPISFYISTSNNLLARKKNYIITNNKHFTKSDSLALSNSDEFGQPTSRLAYLKQTARFFEDMTSLDFAWLTDPKFSLFSSYKPKNKFEKSVSSERASDVSDSMSKLNDSQPDYSGNQIQKQERSKPVYKQPDLPNFENILLNKAKKLFEEAKKGRRSKFYVRNELKRWSKDYPQGKTKFNLWYHSSDARQFREWILEIETI